MRVEEIRWRLRTMQKQEEEVNTTHLLDILEDLVGWIDLLKAQVEALYNELAKEKELREEKDNIYR